jgi:hypothetical protein
LFHEVKEVSIFNPKLSTFQSIFMEQHFLHRKKELLLDGRYPQTFIKPTDLQINLEAKSKPGGESCLI